ncbi:MAG: hypothetical protein JJE44_11260 [Flavobacteriaceae bacterium]|nr:hypothetical protein [Flavobacteriaceae bacterium]
MTRVKLAYYREEDWKRFIDLADDDRENLHDNWKDWHKSFLKAKKDLISQGFDVVDIEIDLDELIIFCKIRGIKNDGKARSQFVQAK